jgi:SAM-dependent methyltransferase
MADFRGEVADYYVKYRRGYPPAVADAIVSAFRLGDGDTVLDLGCGSGQLTAALAGRAGAVIGMDPEPDMLARAPRAANVSYRLGSDRDVSCIEVELGAMTVAVAIHWMDRDALFRAVRPKLRAGGGIAVVTNGAPLWSQDAGWSRELRSGLERLLGRPVTASCQTDHKGRALTSDALARAGYRIGETTVGYDAPLTVDELVGGAFSAVTESELPPPSVRRAFADSLRERLGDDDLTEHVRVTLQFGWV